MEAGEKDKKPRNIQIDPKISVKILFHLHLPFFWSIPKILKALPNTFPTKTKPTKCPARKKK